MGPLQRLNLGREALLWQGFPLKEVEDKVLDSHTDAFLGDLGGNAFSSTVVVALLCGILTALPWAGKQPESTTVEEASPALQDQSQDSPDESDSDGSSDDEELDTARAVAAAQKLLGMSA